MDPENLIDFRRIILLLRNVHKNNNHMPAYELFNRLNAMNIDIPHLALLCYLGVIGCLHCKKWRRNQKKCGA